ncbi:hypothetical protein ISN75_10650 [Dyella marensis]|uniref:hypothetical protein n=1 Tax=Dyella marensis TaxID=500610 RepID=UPI0031D19D5F
MSRKRLKWLWNEERQEFVTPSGRTISLHEIARLLDDYAQCRVDLAGPWLGWKIRGQRLIPPGGSMRGPAITIHNAAAFNRWINQPAFEPAREQPRHQARARKQGHLKLVFSR